MTTGTYTNYYNVLEKLRDAFVLSGWTVNAFKVNMDGTATRGHRLHVSKSGVYIALAGSDVGQPDSSFTDWKIHNVKGICFEITNIDRSNEALWYSIGARRQTCQVSENQSFFLFIKDDGFLLCTRFSPRKYSFFNFMTHIGYDKTKKYQMASGSCGASRSPEYKKGWSGIPQFPFIGRSSTGVEDISGAYTGSFIDIETKKVVTSFSCNHFQNGAAGFSSTSGNEMVNLGYGRTDITYSNSNSNIIHRTKTPFSEKYTPLPIEFFNAGTAKIAEKVALVEDMYVVYMKSYEAEELFQIGDDNFIILPFLEKSATDLTTMYFGYNMGIAIKIGES